jgi:hypothetical protein
MENYYRHGIAALHSILKCVDTHNGLIAALAGIAVAFFTFTLKRSTDRLWKSGRDALEKVERAFIFLDGFNCELTLASDQTITPLEHLPERYKLDPDLFITRFAVQPRWKNGGNTPTRNMRIQVHSRGPSGPIPPEYLYRDAPVNFFLAPKAVEASNIIEIPEVKSLVDYGLNPVGAEPMVFIWGRADYEDIFEHKHFIEWCYHIRLERHRRERMQAGFIQWGDYNRTDEQR